MSLHRSLAPLTLISFGLALACGGGESTAPEYRTPLLSELAPDADGLLDVVDRSSTLAGAKEAADATPGPALDLATLPAGFGMDADSRGLDTTEGYTTGAYLDAPAGPGTFNNLVHAAAMVAIADATTATIVGVPAAAIDIAIHGQVTQIDDNVWAATNSVSDGTTTVTGLFVVAWVEVGWLAEMRLWSSDGRYDNTRWFTGFVSWDGALGWWDVYDAQGTLAGVIEWLAAANGDGELGIAATSGESAGDMLGYLFLDDTAWVGLHDASAAEDYWVEVAADHSGESRAPDYNGGAPACWDANGYDAPCPE